MTSRRLRLGWDIRVVSESPDGLHLEGTMRLRPGQVLELIGPPHEGNGSSVMRACVQSWSVARVGQDGTTYRGHCRWQ